MKKSELNKRIETAKEFAGLNTNDKTQSYWNGMLQGLTTTKINSKKFIATIEEFAGLNTGDKTQAHWIGYANAIRIRKGIETIDALKVLQK